MAGYTAGAPPWEDRARQRWPKERLEWWRLVLTTILLVLVLPIAVWQLVKAPRLAAERAIGGAVR